MLFLKVVLEVKEEKKKDFNSTDREIKFKNKRGSAPVLEHALILFPVASDRSRPNFHTLMSFQSSEKDSKDRKGR